MSVSKPVRFISVLLLSALVLSCDVSGSLFSQSELAEMYDIWIDMDGLPLADGDLVHTGTSLVPVIELRSGFSSPRKLSLVLVDEAGIEAAHLGFVTEPGDSTDAEGGSSYRTVSSIEGHLPSFTLPDGLAEGYYFLETRLYDTSDRILSDTSILVLVYDGEVSAPRIEVFPSSPTKGQAVYLRLASSRPANLDPWIRWHVGGEIGKEGYVSDFADRLVWQIPEADGFFSVKAELFPFRPPAMESGRSIASGASFSSPFRADLILVVGPAQPDPLLDAISQYCSMNFKSEPETLLLERSDETTMKVTAIGTPYLESHEHGYGHALLEGAGYLIPGTILPKGNAPFSLGISFDPEDDLSASGALVTLYGSDGSSSILQLGVSDGFPYVEAGDSTVKATSSLPAGLCRLVVEVIPLGTDASESIVSLFLNDELAGTGVISDSRFEYAESITTLIGGPEGLDAVYDGLAVAKGRYQAFFVARAHEFGNRLVAASGFEGGSTGKGIYMQGPAETGDGFIRLSMGANLEIPVPAAGFSVDIDGFGAPLELFLVMDDGSTVALQGGAPVQPAQLPASTGEQPGMAPADKPAPITAAEAGYTWLPDHPVTLAVEAIAGGLRINDAAGSRRVLNSRTAASLRIRPALAVPSTIRSVTVLTFNSMDPASRTASPVAVTQSGSVY